MPWRRDRLPTMVFLGFPGGSDSKGSIVIQLWSLSWEDPLEEGMATHSNSLTWKILMVKRRLVGYSPWGPKESDMTEWLNTHMSVQFSSVAQSCPTLCDPMNHSMPGLPVHHQLLEFTQTHGHRVSDAIQPSHPLLSLFPPAPNLSQHQSLFQSVNSSHEVAKVLEFQLQHQSFQRTPRTDLL